MTEVSSASPPVIMSLKGLGSCCGTGYLPVRPSFNLSLALVRPSRGSLTALQYHRKAEEGHIEK